MEDDSRTRPISAVLGSPAMTTRRSMDVDNRARPISATAAPGSPAMTTRRSMDVDNRARPISATAVSRRGINGDSRAHPISGTALSCSPTRRSVNGDSRARPLSGTTVPGSPAPTTRRKRSNTGQSSEDSQPPARKLTKYEKEVTFHILQPNGTSFKFQGDAARIHSLEAFLDLVKRKALDRPMRGSRQVEWDSNVKLLDSLCTEIKNEGLIKLTSEATMGSTIIVLVQDGHPNPSDYTDENMWNVTPKREMLGSLPQGYTLETALADQVDNALQAVHGNPELWRSLVSVHLSRDKITIFDTGRGMDASDENCIAKWGTVGSSKHRKEHREGVGGKAPFLKPYFGKYGAGGVASAFHLGKCVKLSSKTVQSNLVATLQLELDQKDDQEGGIWRTPGGFRQPTVEERELSPHGSFTRVEITKLKKQYCITENEQHYWKVENVRRLLKEIYFPYMQSEKEKEDGSSSETIFPVEFQVNNKDLLDVGDCETAISNTHSCTGKKFVFDIYLTRQDDGRDRTVSIVQGPKIIEGANARVSCQYFPNVKGKEALEAVLEHLNSQQPSRSMTFENMNRVTLRWLGRLLPEAKWPVFPFMVPPVKREERSLKVWAKRVRAFVDTDAGFHPVMSKTQLETDQPFVVALRNIGSVDLDKTSASGVKVSIKCETKQVTPVELADLYQKWVREMHGRYDEEFLFPYPENAKYIFNGGERNCLKDLGLGSSNCIMLHTHMKDSNNDYEIKDTNPIFFKLPKGPGLRADKYVRLEYFYHDAAEAEDFRVNFLCRGVEVDSSEGCQLTNLEDGSGLIFEIKRSEYFPATLLSTAQRLDAAAWKKKQEELFNKSPGSVEILDQNETEKFEAWEAFPGDMSSFEAGYALPKDFLVVVRPRKRLGATKQGIVQEAMDIKLEVKHCTCFNATVCRNRRVSVPSGKASLSHSKSDHGRVVWRSKSKSTVKNCVKGLYVFSTESSEVNPLVKLGTYTFRFELESEKYKDVQPAVSSIEILPSKITAKWTLCSHPGGCMIADHENVKDDKQTLVIRLNERVKEDIFLQKYDLYGNKQAFEEPMAVDLDVVTLKGESLAMQTKAKASKVASTEERHRLPVKDILFANGSLKKLASTHEALLRVHLGEEQQANMKCAVFAGALEYLEVISSEPPIQMGSMSFQDDLRPGEVIKKLTLQGLDQFKNKVETGRKLDVVLDGVEFQDNRGFDRVLEENGIIQFGGLLKVTSHYNSTGSITFQSGDETIVCTINFNTVKRRLVANQVNNDISPQKRKTRNIHAWVATDYRMCLILWKRFRIIERLLVPAEACVGRQLQGISIMMVDEFGDVDTSVNAIHESISVDWLRGVTYRLINGQCLLPSIQMPEKSGDWKGNASFSGDPSLCVQLTVKLAFGTASTLGSARDAKNVLTAECGVPFPFPFKAYDDNQTPALLSDALEKSVGYHHPAISDICIRIKWVAKETTDDDGTVCRSLKGECKKVTMSMVDGTPAYEAHIVISGSPQMYMMTLTDSSLTLHGKAESLCKLHHGPVAQLLLTRSDGIVFQGYRGSLPIIEVKRRSENPELTVTLLDSHGNECISCEKKTLTVRLMDCPSWKEQVIEVNRGIGRLDFSSLEVPVGRYEVLMELDRPPQEWYCIEETKPVQKRFLLGVDHGNYPASLRLTNSDVVTIMLNKEDIQYVPPMTVSIESADRLRLKSRPTVGVKIFSEGYATYGPKEYLGAVVESEKKMDTLTYKFAKVCVPSHASMYRMEFFVLDCGVASQTRYLVVRHGAPKKMMITQRDEIKALTINVVDAHGNLCDSKAWRHQLRLEMTLCEALENSARGLTPCSVLSNCTASVAEGKGEFEVLQLTQGIPGFYSLTVSEVHREGEPNSESLIPAKAQVVVFQGDQPLQPCNQNGHFKVIDDCRIEIAMCKKEIQHKKAELQSFTKAKTSLEGDLLSNQRGREVLVELQRKFHDAKILQEQLRQPQRDFQCIVHDIRRWAGRNNTAPLAFWEAFSEGTRLRDFVGLVVMLAQVEDDDLNRMFAEFLGPSSLLLIIARSQSAIALLEEHDARGRLDESRGLHGFARSRGYEIVGRYDVLSLMDTRPYRNVNTKHSQRILDINPPMLSGQVPRGFLGYAVNLIYLRPEHLEMRVDTKSEKNVGLRESLFFHLFKFLQVYDTRDNMLLAKEGIKDFGAAISLDGGIIKANQRQQLGRAREHVPISFGLVPFEERKNVGSLLPPASASFQRLRECAVIGSDIIHMENELTSVKSAIENTAFELTKLQTNLDTLEKQKRDAQEASKEYQNQLQRAATAIAAKNGHITGADRPQSQSNEMRVFMLP